MKRKPVKKSAAHKKNAVWTSSWTFSIITVGLSLLVLMLVYSVKQQPQVLGTTQTTIRANFCATTISCFWFFCGPKITCTPSGSGTISPIPTMHPNPHPTCRPAPYCLIHKQCYMKVVPNEFCPTPTPTKSPTPTP